jgi:cell division protein FtsW (lipid II flippase)
MKGNPFRITEGARRMIFFGVSMFPATVLVYIMDRLDHEHYFHERTMPYIILGIFVIIIVFNMVAYRVTPKRIILPLGIVSWIIVAVVACWYVWFVAK